MTPFRCNQPAVPAAKPACFRSAGFTLVELLTVIFIIALLIGILIPSISAARTAAKKATTAKAIDSIKVGLEMFKSENESDFRLTNGYPPSFSHPPIPPDALTPQESVDGTFPFLEAKPVGYGAMWLPAMLMGVDSRGYIKRGNVPKTNPAIAPDLWYESILPSDQRARPAKIDRQALYMDPGATRTLKLDKLPGRRPDPSTDYFDTDWDQVIKFMPVIVDAFDQPILYYAANAHGKPTNMLGAVRDGQNNYTGGDQQTGVPYYFHQDNEGFTGLNSSPTVTLKLGWDFGGRERGHAIAFSGSDLTPEVLIDPVNRDSFARYIVDRKLYVSLTGTTNTNVPMRPCNAESFLLISAGPDGRYGTTDDVSNLPPFPEE